MQHRWAALALCLAAAGVAYGLAPVPAAPATAWEYRVASERDLVVPNHPEGKNFHDQLSERLNDIGGHGWELTGIREIPAEPVYYFFRRRK